MKKTSKALPKAQVGKVIKAAGKRAADAVVRKKEMANNLKAAALLGVGAGGWMAVNEDVKKKKLGPYSDYARYADSVSVRSKKKTGGVIRTKKK
jgi:hypothetical protein